MLIAKVKEEIIQLCEKFEMSKFRNILLYHIRKMDM